MKNIFKLRALLLVGSFLWWPLGLNVATASLLQDRIHNMHWDQLEVTWLEEDRFPTYDVLIYFADGALSDQHSFIGETDMMFQLLRSGTNRFQQKQINDSLEYFGVDLSSSITHEYSTVSFSGLVKDLIPTTKMICHLFTSSVYPESEVSKYKKGHISDLTNLVMSHAELAERVFRNITLAGTPYAEPVDGTIKSLAQINSERLQHKLKYFNEKVKKKIYIAGPKKALPLFESLMAQDCRWTAQNQSFKRELKPEQWKHLKKLSASTQEKIYLVTVPEANQAQVRMGRFLQKEELQNPDLMAAAVGFIGEGFTSRLMQELRVKRGLTYGAGAAAGGQRDYGRALITTSSRNENVVEALNVIKDVVKTGGQGAFSDQELQKSLSYQGGKYLFRFENNSAFLAQLMQFDHIDRNIEELYKFPEALAKMQKMNIAGELQLLFSLPQQTILVLGDKSLLKTLRTLGPVQMQSYKHYL